MKEIREPIEPIVIKNPFKHQKQVDIHLKTFGHLPSKCGGEALKCPWIAQIKQAIKEGR